MSKIKNWSLVTERDLLFLKDGCSMSEKDWEYYTGEGEKISKEQHLAFEVGLATGKRFYPKAEYRFAVSGYAKRYSNSRYNQPVLRPNGEVGDIILTSNLAWAEKKGDTIYFCTRSGSLYELEDMIREEGYPKPEDTGTTNEELDEIMHKYFNSL